MDEESIKTIDLNPEDLQGMISELSAKLEEDHRTSEELEVTIRSQRKRISNLKSEKRLLKALNENIDGDINRMQKERSEMSCFLPGSQVAELMNQERAKLLKQQRALEEQREQYRLALDSCCQDLDKRWMDIEHLEGSITEFVTMIQELKTKNKDLEVQVEEAVVSGGANIDQPISNVQLPHSHVEFSDMEEEQLSQEVKDEKQEESSVDTDVQTKSWWRQQVRKVFKGMGTFRLRLKRCLGGKRSTSKTPVARLITVQPAIITMDIGLQHVSEGMPPVSV